MQLKYLEGQKDSNDSRFDGRQYKLSTDGD
jgi:hypothetical protein